MWSKAELLYRWLNVLRFSFDNSCFNYSSSSQVYLSSGIHIHISELSSYMLLQAGKWQEIIWYLRNMSFCIVIGSSLSSSGPKQVNMQDDISFVCENTSYQLWQWLCLSLEMEYFSHTHPSAFTPLFTPTSHDFCCCLPLWTFRCIYSSMVCTKSRGKTLLCLQYYLVTFLQPFFIDMDWSTARHSRLCFSIICAHLAISTIQAHDTST